MQWHSQSLNAYLLGFEKCVHLCNPNSCQDIKHYHHSRKFPHFLPGKPPPLRTRSKLLSLFFLPCIRLDWLSTNINWSYKMYFFVRFISFHIMFLRAIHDVVCINSSFCFIAGPLYEHTIFYLCIFLIERCLGCIWLC